MSDDEWRTPTDWAEADAAWEAGVAEIQDAGWRSMTDYRRPSDLKRPDVVGGLAGVGLARYRIPADFDAEPPTEADGPDLRDVAEKMELAVYGVLMNRPTSYNPRNITDAVLAVPEIAAALARPEPSTLPEGMTAERLREIAEWVPEYPLRLAGDLRRWADEIEARPAPARPEIPEGHEVVVLPTDFVTWARREWCGSTDDSSPWQALDKGIRATVEARPAPPAPETARVSAYAAVEQRRDVTHPTGPFVAEAIMWVEGEMAVCEYGGAAQPIAPDGTVEVLR